MHDEKLIFDTALGMESTEKRAKYLRTACGADALLLKRVESLLDAAGDQHGFLEKRAADSFEMSFDSLDQYQVGQTIGRYKLLERIGEGGFGDVYMAEQLEPVVRRVALKIIKPGMDTKQVIARFEAERQALAMMDHPNIGQFLDAGATQNGRPYFVMELVRGIPITEFCDSRRVSTDQRLRLFIDVCAAVEHAHQKGIIHRDIKPTNILVYDDGKRPIAKVIDFGIAKATQGRLTDKTLFTQFHQFIGTPSYMSPEQAQMSGIDVDTRSDIYSLGVLLYEMLTGTTPLDKDALKQQAFEETCRRIRDEESPTPSKRISTLTQTERVTLARSQRTDPMDLASRLRGDLDWIVMKAVEKDRTRRYKTTDALASDVIRHMNDEVVTAGPPNASYHFRKFIRRNRGSVLTALAFVTVCMIGGLASLFGWAQAINAQRLLSEQIAETETALDEVTQSRDKAQAATEQAAHAKERAVRAAYIADIQAAHQALRLKNLGLARQLIHDAAELDPDRRLRHWEWRALWDRSQGNAEFWFGGDKQVSRLSIHPDGKLVAASGPHYVRVWDIFNKSIDHEIEMEERAIALFSPDGKRLYAVDESGVVRAWQLPDFSATDFKLSHGVQFHWDMDFAIAPDGLTLATYSGRTGKQITVWDTKSQKVKARIPRNNWACPIAFSPDSASLALGTRPIRIIDLQSLEETLIEDIDAQHWSGKSGVEFSPDGKMLVSLMGVSDTDVMIHRVLDGTLVARLQQHTAAADAAAFSPDGSLLASASRDRTVLLWDLATHEVVADLREHDLGVVDIEFTPDGSRLLSCGRDGKICVWNVFASTTPRWPLSRTGLHHWNSPGQQVSCSADGRMLASTRSLDSQPGIAILSPTDLVEERTLAPSTGIVQGLLFSPTRNLLAMCNEVGALQFLDFDDAERIETIDATEGMQIIPLHFQRNGEHLLAVTKPIEKNSQDPRQMIVYSIKDRNAVAAWPISNESSGAIAPNGQQVVTGHRDGLRFWSLDNLEQSNHVIVAGLSKETPGTVWSVDYSPDGSHVIAGANLTGRVEIVDSRTMEAIGYLSGHMQHIMAVKFSPDGRRVASGGNAGHDAIKIWDFESRRELMSMSVPGAWSSRQIQWLPDGNSILLLNGSSLVNIFRVPSIEEVERLDGKVAPTTN